MVNCELLKHEIFIVQEFPDHQPAAISMHKDHDNTMSGKPGPAEERDDIMDLKNGCIPDTATGMTLEQIVDMTGEFEHLNELVMIHIGRTGGFAGKEAYLRTVQPILDLLEVEIRVRFRPGMTRQEMKLVVQDWIDQEIKELR
jgi:hypothetical protein